MSNSTNFLMHPRNKYRENPPDFKNLADMYPEFKQYCKLELNGKVNFCVNNLPVDFIVCGMKLSVLL